MKARTAGEVKRFEDIPNIGKRMAEDFTTLGIRTPDELARHDAYALYRKMCVVSGVRQDPCVLDTYMAAIDFMQGGEAKPWWSYTEARKRAHPDL